MTEHHPNCEDATGAYPGSCTCKTIAMDNLIAQDADLIDSPLVDRLRWVSEWYFVDPVDGTAYASDDPLDAADRIEELEARYEKSQDQIDRLIAENERIRERLGWICAVMDLDDAVSLQWVYTELEALRGIANKALAGDSHD